ncbi:MAG: gamma-glutamylcyclotransferase family protein [Pseudomonadota bacterium]
MRPGDLLAIYGSLRRGLGLPDAPELSGASRHVGSCLLQGRLYDLGDYPGLLTARPGCVHGEFLRIIAPSLSDALDAFELYDPRDEAGSLYLRRRVILLRPRRLAWVYIYNRTPHGPVIPLGDWRRHRLIRQTPRLP